MKEGEEEVSWYRNIFKRKTIKPRVENIIWLNRVGTVVRF